MSRDIQKKMISTMNKNEWHKPSITEDIIQCCLERTSSNVFSTFGVDTTLFFVHFPPYMSTTSNTIEHEGVVWSASQVLPFVSLLLVFSTSLLSLAQKFSLETKEDSHALATLGVPFKSNSCSSKSFGLDLGGPMDSVNPRVLEIKVLTQTLVKFHWCAWILGVHRAK